MAMEMSDHYIAADKLAHDKDVGVREVKLSGLCLCTMHNTELDVFILDHDLPIIIKARQSK